jgi:hypothetical protein
MDGEKSDGPVKDEILLINLPSSDFSAEESASIDLIAFLDCELKDVT